MPGKRLMHRGVIRLCAFALTLSILAVFAPGSAQAQMCVRYARQLTGFDIQGDAWKWWGNSAGRYQHGARPVVGSVLVFRRTGRLSYGHVSTVSRVVDRRTILVDHSWLEGDVLHHGMKVIDTSPNNTWTSVKVWYEPANHLGLRAYPTFGFIYPHGTKGVDQPLTVAAADAREDLAGEDLVADDRASDDSAGDTGRDNSPVRPTARSAVAHAPAAAPVRTAMMGAAHRKPASAVPAAPVVMAAAPAEAPAPVAHAPRRKPGQSAAPAAAPAKAGSGVEYTEVPQVAVPRRKPAGHGGSQQVADRGVAELAD